MKMGNGFQLICDLRALAVSAARPLMNFYLLSYQPALYNGLVYLEALPTYHVGHTDAREGDRPQDTRCDD